MTENPEVDPGTQQMVNHPEMESGPAITWLRALAGEANDLGARLIKLSESLTAGHDPPKVIPVVLPSTDTPGNFHF